MRRRNPLGIGVGDVLKWGAYGLLIYWGVSKFGELRLPGLAPVGEPFLQIAAVNHGTPQIGQSINIEWIVNHKGGAGHYRVGVGIGYWLGPFFVYNQQIEGDLLVLDNPDWRSYSVGLTARVEVSDDKMEAYVADLGGQVIDKRFV